MFKCNTNCANKDKVDAMASLLILGGVIPLAVDAVAGHSIGSGPVNCLASHHFF